MSFGAEVSPGENYSAPGRAALRKYAVHYQGPWETLHDGVQRAVRAHARALADTGVPVLLESFSRTVVDREGQTHQALWGMMEPEVMAEVEHLVLGESTYLAPRIKHVVNGLGADQLQALLAPRRFADCETLDEVQAKLAWWLSWTVAFTVWETTTVDAEVAKLLAACAQSWVPSESNRRALILSGVPEAKVHVVPHPYVEDSDVRKLLRRPSRPAPLPGLIDAQLRFYSIGKWEPRKCFPEAMEALLRAYKPGESWSYTLKTSSGNWKDYPRPAEALQQVLNKPEVRANGWTLETLSGHLRVITGIVREDEIVQLHYRNNIYLSSASGEGYGLPAFDAAVAGNRLVYVAGTGPQTFARDDDVPVVVRETEPAHSSYGWGSREVYRVDPAALELAVLAVRPPEYGKLVSVSERFSRAAVGKLMRELILEVGSPESKRCLANGGNEP